MEVGRSGMPEVALQLLQTDMQRLEDRMRDEKFARELYRALANNSGRRTESRPSSAGGARRSQTTVATS